jgi:tripartite-type tricarboxylate transporter receptor subunit TctC
VESPSARSQRRSARWRYPRLRRAARSIATDLSQRFGQSVVVDNRTGASGNIGTGMAARAAPDGNTLLMIAKVFVVNPSLFRSVPYDPAKSFDPII